MQEAPGLAARALWPLPPYVLPPEPKARTAAHSTPYSTSTGATAYRSTRMMQSNAKGPKLLFTRYVLCHTSRAISTVALERGVW